MFLTLRGPTGFRSSVDLGSVPIWDLGMEIRPNTAPGFETMAGAALVMVLTAPINGMMIRLVLDVLDTQSKGEELPQVVAVGLPTGNRSDDKARLAEALKILINAGQTQKVSDEVVANSAAFVDCFWNFCDALWGVEQPLADASVLGRHTNSVSNYSWAISRTRNGALFPPATTAAAGMGAAPGAGYVAPLGSPAPAPAAGAAGGLGPPPGTEGKGKKGSKSTPDPILDA